MPEIDIGFNVEVTKGLDTVDSLLAKLQEMEKLQNVTLQVDVQTDNVKAKIQEIKNSTKAGKATKEELANTVAYLNTITTSLGKLIEFKSQVASISLEENKASKKKVELVNSIKEQTSAELENIKSINDLMSKQKAVKSDPAPINVTKLENLIKSLESYEGRLQEVSAKLKDIKVKVDIEGKDAFKGLLTDLENIKKDTNIEFTVALNDKGIKEQLQNIADTGKANIDLNANMSKTKASIGALKDTKDTVVAYSNKGKYTKEEVKTAKAYEDLLDTIIGKLSKVYEKQLEIKNSIVESNTLTSERVAIINSVVEAKNRELEVAKKITAQSTLNNELTGSNLTTEAKSRLDEITNKLNAYEKKLADKTPLKAVKQTEATKEETVSGTTDYNRKLNEDKAYLEKLKQAQTAHSQWQNNHVFETNNIDKRQRERLFKAEMDMIKSNTQEQVFISKQGEVQTHKARLEGLKKQKLIHEEELEYFEKSVQKKQALAQGDKADFTKDISKFMMFKQASSVFAGQMKEMEAFEDAVYQTGVLGDKSRIEIRKLRDEMTALGTVIPRTTQAIVEQIGVVVVTGRTYNQALTLVQAGANLALASGEELSTATKLLNDVMIAFDIKVSRTTDVMNILHSASKATPLDFISIIDGMKNSASALRNFIESTSKSGVALDDYKERLLGFNAALIGNQMALGRTASSAGLSVRNLSTKLISMEKHAEALFDSEMRLNSVMVDTNGQIVKQGQGFQLTADVLGQLANEDLPKAVQLLSQLYNTGEISTKTLSKMFTGRQAPFLIAQLGLMKGNVETYIDGVTKMAVVTDDVEKAMHNWTYELKILRNNIQGLKTSTSGFMEYIGKDALQIINKVLASLLKFQTSGSWLSHSLGGFKDGLISVVGVMSLWKIITVTSQLVGFTKALQDASGVMSGFKMVSKGIGPALMDIAKSGNLWVASIMTLVATLTMILSYYKRIKEYEEMARLEQVKYTREVSEMNLKIQATTALLETQLRFYDTMSNEDWVSNWEKGYDIIGKTVEKMETLAKLLEKTSKLKFLNTTDINRSFSEDIKKEYEVPEKLAESLESSKEYKEIQKEIAELQEMKSSFWDKFVNPSYLQVFKKNEDRIRSLKAREQAIVKGTMEDKADTFNTSKFLEEPVTLRQEQQAHRNKLREEFNRIISGLKRLKTGTPDYSAWRDKYEKELEEVRTAFATKVPTKMIDKAIRERLNIPDNNIPIAPSSFEGKTPQQLLFEGDLTTASEYVKFLEGIGSSKAPEALALFNKRLKMQTAAFSSLVSSVSEYINHMDNVNSLLTDIRMEAFNRTLSTKNIDNVKDYIELAEKMQLLKVDKDTGDRTRDVFTGYIKELEAKAKELGEVNFDVNSVVRSGDILNYTSEIDTLNKSIKNLSESVDNVDTLNFEAPDKKSIKAYWEQIGGKYKVNDKELNYDEFEKRMTDKAKLKEMLEYNLEMAKKTKDLALESQVNALLPKLNEILLDTFFYYDETKIRQLKLNELSKTGLDLLANRRELIEEEFNKTKEKYAWELDNIKELGDLKLEPLQLKIDGEQITSSLSEILSSDILKFDDTYLETLLSALNAKKQELETKALGKPVEEGSEAKLELFTKEDKETYTTIQKSMGILDGFLKSSSENSGKLTQNTADVDHILKETRKYYKDISTSFGELTEPKNLTEFEKMNLLAEENNDVTKSRADIIALITAKRGELLDQSTKEKEITDGQKQNIEKELNLYKKMLGIVDGIADSVGKTAEETKKLLSEVSKLYGDLIKDLEPEESTFKKAKDKLASFKDELYQFSMQFNEGIEFPVKFSYKDALLGLDSLDKIIKDINVRIEENSAKANDDTLSQEEKRVANETLEADKAELEVIKDLVDSGSELVDKQRDLNSAIKESVVNLASMTQSLLSGEGISFTGGFVNEGLKSIGKLVANRMTGDEKDPVTPEDYVNMAGLAIETLNTNLNRGIEASLQQLELDISMLEMRKQFLRTEEEINANSREILDKQKKQAELEAMKGTAFLGNTGIGASAMGGATQGIMTGATAGIAMGAGPVGLVVGGIIGTIGGILGGNSAKKQAKAQQKQLELQFVSNALLDRQNRLIEQMTTAIDKMVSTSYLGIEKSIKQALEGVVTAPTHSLNLLYQKRLPDFAYRGTNIGKEIDKKNNKITELINNYKALTDVGTNSLVSDEYLAQIDELLETLKSIDGDDKIITLHIDGLERFKQEIAVLRKISENRKEVFYGSAFGFDVEKVNNSAGNLEDIRLTNWKIREEIIKNFGDESYSAGQEIAESFIDGFNFNLASNDKQIQDTLDEIEADFKTFFQLKADDMNYDEVIAKIQEYGQAIGSVSRQELMGFNEDELENYNKLLEEQVEWQQKLRDIEERKASAGSEEEVIGGIIIKTEKLKEQQKGLQAGIVATNELWLASGGSLSDIANKLTEIEKSFYDNLSSGDFANVGNTMGQEIVKGVADTLKDSFINIFSLEEQVKELVATTSTFDDVWIKTAETRLKLGSKFKDLTIEQIKDNQYIRESLVSIGYKDEDINDELIGQVQKILTINKLLEEQVEDEKAILTLVEMITESRGSLDTLVDQYTTKLHNGTFSEVELNDLLKERQKLLGLEVSERQLISGVMVQMAQKGVSINEILSHLPQNLQEALNTIVNINYAMQDTSKELSVSDKLWNSQVASIRDTLKAKLMSAKYSEDLANIDNKVLEIQQAVTSEKEKQIRIDSLQERISKAKANEKLNKFELKFANITNLSQEGRQKLQDSINEAKELQIQLQNELTSVIANKPLETLQQELTGLIEGLGNTLENDTDLKRIDELFADKVLNGDSLTESYKSIFARLNEQTSKFTETLEFWFRGGLKLIGDDLTEDWQTTISEVNEEFFKMKMLEESIAEDQKVLAGLWKDGTITASLDSVVDKLGAMAGTVKSSISSALNAKGFLNIATTLGSEISQAIATGWNTDIINEKLRNEYVDLVSQANTAMMSGSLADINKLSSEMQSVASKIEYENVRQQALLDLFNYNAEINYATQNTQIDYATGTTKENVYNITYNTTVTTGALVTDSYSGAQKVTDQLATNIIHSLEKHGKKL